MPYSLLAFAPQFVMRDLPTRSRRHAQEYPAAPKAQGLKALRDRNLRESTFEERADLVAKLGIKILMSEDLKSRKVSCQLNLAKVNEGREHAGFAKVTFGRPYHIKGKTFERTFALVY